MQMWYCENEECGVCINDGRYHCVGCGCWFCFGCTSPFVRENDGRVCHGCFRVWLALCEYRGLRHTLGWRQSIMHQNIQFTHMIVRYDDVDGRLAVAVCYTTSLEEAETLLLVFMQSAPCFAPTAVYAIRNIAVACLYQKVL